MSNEDRSSYLLRDFEPSGVRLKRKLRLILSKTIRRDKVGEQNVTLSEFIFYLSTFLLQTHTNRDSRFDVGSPSASLSAVAVICTRYRTSQEMFNADICIRRLLVNKLELNSVKTVEQFWTFVQRFNEELYS